MKIVMVSNNYRPYSGGLVSSLEASAKGLIERGCQVKLITLNFSYQSIDLPFVWRLPSIAHFSYHDNPMTIPLLPTFFIRRCIKEFNPDIIHLHHPFLLGKRAQSYAEKNGIATIFTYHTLYDQYAHYLPMPASITKKIINQQVGRFCASVDGIIAPSSAIQQHIKQFHAVDTPSTIIPSAINDAFMVSSMPQKNMSKPCTILLVSRFAQEKNIFAALDLFSQLPSNQFQFICAGYGIFWQAAIAYAQAKKLDDRIKFIEKPTQQELSTLYQKADLFFFPSTIDTQGIVMAESMAHATPVIAYDGPGQRDIIINGYNGFIIQHNDDFYPLVQSIIANDHRYQSLRNGAWQTAQQYRSSIMADRLISFYQRIMQTKKAGPVY